MRSGELAAALQLYATLEDTLKLGGIPHTSWEHVAGQRVGCCRSHFLGSPADRPFP